MDTPSMERCREFLEGLHGLSVEEFRAKVAATRAPSSAMGTARRRELEQRCDALELWSLRDDVETLCWDLPARERARLREAIADEVLVILAGH